ncbi:MAG: hypothetical protein GEU83_12010 [Pseudonocardiaceae bacterium]|nr:hypothetical protein [Pseudonocardiaceae bacterium]
MTAKMTSALPKDDRDGLDPGIFLKDPDVAHLAVVLLDTKAITSDVDSGEEYPTVRVRAIESFHRNSETGKQLQRIWRETWEQRTGNRSLPLDIDGDDE